MVCTTYGCLISVEGLFSRKFVDYLNRPILNHESGHLQIYTTYPSRPTKKKNREQVPDSRRKDIPFWHPRSTNPSPGRELALPFADLSN